MKLLQRLSHVMALGVIPLGTAAAVAASVQTQSVYSITGPTTGTFYVNTDGTAAKTLTHYWKFRQNGVVTTATLPTWSVSAVSGTITMTISRGGAVTYQSMKTPTARVRVQAVYQGQTYEGFTDITASGLSTVTPPPTTTQPAPTPTEPQPAPSGTYQTSLVNGRTLDPFLWQGRQWRAYVRSDDVSLDYPLRYTRNKVRFELRPEDFSGTAATSRSELGGSYSAYPRLPNNVPLWGAMSFNHHCGNTTSGVHGQIHMGSTAGGSPALAFRRSSDGPNVFKVTTNSQSGSGTTGSVTRASLNVSCGAVHDLVYRVVLNPTAGSLTVWIDRAKVVDLPRIPIGHSNAEHYWNFGAYYSGGIKSTVVAEYANHVYPSTADLSARTVSGVAWPAD